MNLIHIRLPEDMRNKLKAYAASNGLSMQTLISELIKEFMDKKIAVANR